MLKTDLTEISYLIHFSAQIISTLLTAQLLGVLIISYVSLFWNSNINYITLKKGHETYSSRSNLLILSS